jgi:hypothetical protein
MPFLTVTGSKEFGEFGEKPVEVVPLPGDNPWNIRRHER